MKLLLAAFFGLAVYGVIVGLLGAAIISALAGVLLYVFSAHLDKAYADIDPTLRDQITKSDSDP